MNYFTILQIFSMDEEPGRLRVVLGGGRAEGSPSGGQEGAQDAETRQMSPKGWVFPVENPRNHNFFMKKSWKITRLNGIITIR